MIEHAIEDLRTYLANDAVDEVLVVEGMKVGRVRLGIMLVKGRNAGFGKLAKDLTKSTRTAERFFEEADLQKILNAQRYVAWAKKTPHRWWCPILALYTGARINELARLKLIDIVQESGR